MTRRTLIVALLAACGDDGGVRTLDDAPTLDVAPGSATVTLRLGRNPLPNHAVIFQGPDFTEIATVTTDASGTASAVVPAGSSVTVLGLRYIANPDIRSVVTVMGVKPGDHLTLNGTASFDQSQVDFTYPAYTGVATANYAIATTCGADAVGAGTTNSLGLDHCSPRIDTVIYARDETGSDPLAFVAKLDQPFAAMIDLTGESWVAIGTTATTYSNIPDAQRYQARRSLVTPRGRVADCYEAADAPGSTRTIAMPCPTIAGTIALDSFLHTDHQVVFEITHRATSTSATYDLAGTTVATASSIELDGPARTATWAETAGTTPDFLIVSLSETQSNEQFYWDVIAPYAGTSLTLPALVGEAAPYVLGAGAYVNQLMTGTATGGYDAIRPFGPFYTDGLTGEIERIVLAYPYDG